MEDETIIEAVDYSSLPSAQLITKASETTKSKTVPTDDIGRAILEDRKSRRAYPEGRTSTLRKVMRFARRTTDSYSQPTKTVDGKTYTLHPTKGWRRS